MESNGGVVLLDCFDQSVGLCEDGAYMVHVFGTIREADGKTRKNVPVITMLVTGGLGRPTVSRNVFGDDAFERSVDADESVGLIVSGLRSFACDQTLDRGKSWAVKACIRALGKRCVASA